MWAKVSMRRGEAGQIVGYADGLVHSEARVVG